MHNTSFNKKPIFYFFRVCVLIIIFSASSFAQTGALVYFKKAENLYRSGNYFLAAKYYEHFLGYNTFITKEVKERAYISKIIRGNRGTSIPKDIALYHLAESYQKLPNYTLAEFYAEKAEKTLSPSIYPLTAYWYAIALKANGKMEESEKQFLQFLETYSRKDSYLTNAQLEIKSLDFIKTQQKIQQPPVTIDNVFINAESSYGLVKIQEGKKVIFTSIIKKDTSIGEIKYQTNIYQANIDGGLITEIFPLFFDNILQYSEAVMSKDGNFLFFTGIKGIPGMAKSAIYMSKKEGEKWGEPVLVEGNVNVAEYNSRQPMLTKDDNYLFFSSDRPGGQGKYDIWFVSLDATYKPGKAINAGKTINTQEDEVCPFYHNKSKTLFFSSKGKIGMGGFDIYKAEGDIGKWQKSINLGAPYNSTKDDLYFFSNHNTDFKEESYFSSDRNTDCCLEIFKAKSVSSPSQIIEESTPPKKTHCLTVYFDFDSSIPNNEEVNKIMELIKTLDKNASSIKISGFTDGVGTNDYNVGLAKKRIESCAGILKSNGIKEDRFIIKIGASCCPVVNEKFEDGSDNSEARKQNRRVLIEFTD